VPFSEGTHRYNIAPTEPVLGVILDREGERVARPLRWGLIPPWASDPRIGNRMINARSETADTRPAYRKLLGNALRRALLPADGFYEWLRSEDRAQPRIPFRFTLADGGLFSFAALWTPGTLDGEPIATVTMLTTRANELVGRLHDRMPVILPDAEAELLWLSRELDAAGAKALCQPLAAARMAAAPASPKVNRPGGEEGPELLVASAA
jgi:putative SOS response-associated peptidase YedK